MIRRAQRKACLPCEANTTPLLPKTRLQFTENPIPKGTAALRVFPFVGVDFGTRSAAV
jgi:hypothetical protein